jgi:hypothetical protein
VIFVGVVWVVVVVVVLVGGGHGIGGDGDVYSFLSITCFLWY